MKRSHTQSAVRVLAVAILATLVAGTAHEAVANGRSKARQIAKQKARQVGKARTKQYVQNKAKEAAKNRAKGIYQNQGKDIIKQKAQSLGKTKADVLANKAKAKQWLKDSLKDRAKDKAKDLVQDHGKDYAKKKFKEYGVEKAREMARNRNNNNHHGHSGFHFGLHLHGWRRPVFIPTTTVVTEVIVVQPQLEEEKIATDELPRVMVGSTVTLAGEDLGEEEGNVLLEIHNMALAAEVNDWDREATTATLPSFALANETPVTIHLLTADGELAESYDAMLIPAMEETE